MRHIGNLPDEKPARAFGDFLLASGIRNELERDANGSWSVWIMEEDQVAAAQAFLERYHANPNLPEFRDAASNAARVREAEAQDLAAYRKRIRTRRSLFQSFGAHGVGVLTYALIFACLVMAYYSDLGKNREFLRGWLISDPEGASRDFLPEVLSGEVWRVFTPIFIHFGIIHLLFNMMWLYQLGCMIEARQSFWHLAALVAGTALFSNLAQYYFSHGHSNFGGMSGVVYGLAGYVWMRGNHDRSSGLFLDEQSKTILLIVMVVCYTGFIPHVANTAHLVGLITGVVWGRVSAFFASQKPK